MNQLALYMKGQTALLPMDQDEMQIHNERVYSSDAAHLDFEPAPTFAGSCYCGIHI